MIYFILLFALVGLAVGSFMTVLIARLPKIILNNTQPSLTEIFSARSQCPACQHKLTWYELIPVLSYMIQKGHCRYCKHPISLSYPVIEIITMGFYIASFLVFGGSLTSIAVMLFSSICIMLIVIDLKHYLLPDYLTLSLLWMGLLLNTQNILTTSDQAIIGAVLGYGFLWLLNQSMVLLTHKHGMGYGDFKMVAALGAWFGYQALPLLLLFSCLTSLISISIWVIVKKQTWQKPYPFGPFLGLTSMTYLWWQLSPSIH